MIASFRFTRTTQRRKHKYKRKERKLKHSDKLSAYILVTHALPLSAMLDSNFARLPQLFMFLRLRTVCHLMLILIAGASLRLCLCLCSCLRRTCKPGLTGAKRGKTRASKARLVLVLHLIAGLRKWREFYQPITERSNAIPKQRTQLLSTLNGALHYY